MEQPLQAELGSAGLGGQCTRQRLPTTTVRKRALINTENACEPRTSYLTQQTWRGTGTFVVGMLVRCELCGKKFINSFYLEKHISKRHGGGIYPGQHFNETSLPSENDSATPGVPLPYKNAHSRAVVSNYVGSGVQEETAEINSTRTGQPATSADPSHVNVSPAVLEQNEVLLSKLQSSNEKVKAEVHKEVNDALKTFQTMLKNEIRGLQTQLAGLETNEKNESSQAIPLRTPVVGESRHQTEEVTSDPGMKNTPKTWQSTRFWGGKSRSSGCRKRKTAQILRCLDVPHQKRSGEKARPESAPESNPATVTSLSTRKSRILSDPNELLRQAIRTLLTFSHREFLLRAQMTHIMKHNSKPLPEEIERHLGLPPLSISSQLARSFLTEGFQQGHRSGLTTQNAPQNFESVAGAMPLFSTGGSCSHQLQKNKDLFQRRFSLKLIRLRDRLRMRPPSPGKMPPGSAAVSYMGASAIPQRPLHLPFVGYRQLVQPVPYPCPSPLLPRFPAGDTTPRLSALIHEKQLSKPFDVAHEPPAQNHPDAAVRSYTGVGIPTHVGTSVTSAHPPSSRQTMSVTADHTTCLHTMRCHEVSSFYRSPDSGNTRDREPLRERAKSVVEVNCVRPAYPAGQFLNEASLRGNKTSDCSQNQPSMDGKSAAEGPHVGVWPSPSSWISAHPHGGGSLWCQGAGPSPHVIASTRSSSCAGPSACEERHASGKAVLAQVNTRQDYAPEPESPKINAKVLKGSQETFGEGGPVEKSRPLLHQNLWQHAVQEG